MGAGVGVWDEFNEVEIWTGGRSMLPVNPLLFEICLCPLTELYAWGHGPVGSSVYLDSAVG